MHRKPQTARLVSIRDCYDTVADLYAEKFFDELTRKPLDRMLLESYAKLTRGKGLVCEIGCGPGEVAHFLHERGVDVVGLDLSPKILEEARRLCPNIEFREGDMLALPWERGTLAGVVAFYAIVHCDESELQQTFREIARVLEPGGYALVSFHVGSEVQQIEEFLGRSIDVEFRFQQPEWVLSAAAAAGLLQRELLIRYPYEEDVEYQSQRGYLLCQLPSGDAEPGRESRSP